MAQKTKTTLMSTVHEKLEKLKMENAKRAKGMKGLKEARERHVKRGKERNAAEGEGKKEGVTKRWKWGICSLQEIRQYQGGTELLIQQLPFQRVIKEIVQGMRADLHLQATVVMVLQEAGEAFLVGLLNK